MGEECSENSVSTATLNWWELHASSLSPLSNTNSTWINNQTNPNSSCSCGEDIPVSGSSSFTNASNLSSLTVEVSSSSLIGRPAASSNEFMGDQHVSDNQLWSHVLSDVCSEEFHSSSQEIGEKFLDALSSKGMTRSSFEPACDYLKKLDTAWEYSGSTSFNGFEKHLNGFSDEIIENNGRLNKLSNLETTWPNAPPDPEFNTLSSLANHHTQSNPSHIKQPFGDSTTCSVGETSTSFPCYGLDMKVKQEYYANEVAGSGFGRSSFNTVTGSLNGFNNLLNGMPNFSPCTRNFSDVISFTSRLARPIVGFHAPIPSLTSSDSRKQVLQTSSPTRTTNRKGDGRTSEVKKKRSEESSDATLKKPKQDTSKESCTKTPKVKLGDRITTLQQIVSPFGKTDTASVLFEAIGYIKFLQEQVQLLSNPYLKTNTHKDPWGSFDKKDKGDAKLDLRSRGLCVVPISCTPQLCRENSGADYCTPAYRGCLYR
ncbi:Transcription factor bHLH111, partial [Mucuna pruriens]